jgi:hypothetical protein
MDSICPAVSDFGTPGAGEATNKNKQKKQKSKEHKNKELLFVDPLDFTVPHTNFFIFVKIPLFS